jgi:hypothetical protein
MVRVARTEGHIILMAPNLTSPLVPLRILKDLLTKHTPYLGITRFSTAYRLVLINVWHSLHAELGWRVFQTRRRSTLENGIVGYDVDAVYTGRMRPKFVVFSNPGVGRFVYFSGRDDLH